jgi:hypothetical protein
MSEVVRKNDKTFINSFDEAFEDLLNKSKQMYNNKAELDEIEKKIKAYEKERDAKIVELANNAIEINDIKNELREIVEMLKLKDKTSKINLSSAPRIV